MIRMTTIITFITNPKGAVGANTPTFLEGLRVESVE